MATLTFTDIVREDTSFIIPFFFILSLWGIFILISEINRYYKNKEIIELKNEIKILNKQIKKEDMHKAYIRIFK